MIAVDVKVVAFGLTPEDRVIVENECAATRVETIKMMRRRQPCKSGADNDQVETFPRITGIDVSVLKSSGMNFMRGANQSRGVAV